MGVEEELLLVDPDSGEPRGVAGRVVDAARWGAPPDLGADAVDQELQNEQIETATAPCTSGRELDADLRRRRSVAADLARRSGVATAPMALSPLGTETTVSRSDRYERMREQYGLLAADQLSCGCHVHVEVDTLDEGVGVLDRIGPWLPVLRAVSANSPFWQGADTGYASYRTTVWNRWPSAGPTGPFESVAGYDDAVAAMLDTGALLDTGMIYFDARLAHELGTVELRAADVCLDVDDAVLLAALSRALVETAARQWRDGGPPSSARHEVLKLAHWRASRSGLGGQLVNPWTGRPGPAHAVLDALCAFVRDAVHDAGDDDVVRRGVARLRERGTGADVQRAIRDRTGSLRGLVRDVVGREDHAAAGGG
ncbi:carboxylate-amine ligase [Pseudonocardia endophytica]|uniref:Putative glutamate--cysteine ligase 2 n=2 Tax=Pseudonocardia endophytica TaxID=401976 RepID=A0A4R1HT80_PSEEN|nr:carboxylate-amine ligase [Pseudonocardia endophytica]